jgi:hypothetical protein
MSKERVLKKKEKKDSEGQACLHSKQMTFQKQAMLR